MGFAYRTREEVLLAEENARLRRKAEADADKAKLHDVAARISMLVIDHINRIVVRPGPTAEERECYEMAQEIRDTDEQLTNLVADVLKIAIDEDQLPCP